MKAVVYTLLAFIIDVTLFGTFIFILLNIVNWVEGKEVTIWNYVASLIIYIFIEGLKAQIVTIHAYMEKELYKIRS